MRRDVMLWTVQVLVAAVFLFAGVMKLVLPAEALKGPIPLPVGFLRFIGTAEVLGALGLVLPGLFRLHRALTPVAAGGLVIIMTGATVISGVWMSIGAALAPFLMGLLSIAILRGRRGWIGGVHLSGPHAIVPQRG